MMLGTGPDAREIHERLASLSVANIAWNDLPLDYLDTWTKQVERVTIPEIRAAFARKLQPDRMVTVVVGGRGEGF